MERQEATPILRPEGNGVNTQVAIKVKRVEERIKAEKKQIQTTLRSFMDLRSGLLGTGGKRRPKEHQKPLKTK